MNNRTAQPLQTCRHCRIPYSWLRSPASLKMTYCGSLCEQADLGFSLEALERYERPNLVEVASMIAATAFDAPAEGPEAPALANAW